MKNTISEKPAVRKRVRIVSARITDVEYQALQKRRKDAGVSMSRYIRTDDAETPGRTDNKPLVR